METNIHIKDNVFYYNCPNCQSKINIVDKKDKELTLVIGDTITETCPECGEILTLKLD